MLAAAFALPASAAPPSTTLARTEGLYADWLDAVGALSAIDSGSSGKVAGRGRSGWTLRLQTLGESLDRALAALDAVPLGAADSRVLAAMKKGRAENAPETPAADPKAAAIRCSDSGTGAADANSLQLALYACFEEIGSHIEFEGRSIVRTTALQELQELPQSERRRELFMALSPLWLAVNDSNTAQSPYRRMLQLNAADLRNGAHSPVSDAASTLGITPAQAEQWLIRILEAWRLHAGGPQLEPWDYWYSSAAAGRTLSSLVPRERVLPLSKNFYRDLGADLDRLPVEHDLEVRPGKAPLAYTEYVRIERRVNGTWQPAASRVSANYEHGGLFVLNELVHEDGHALHFAALRTRPAFFSLGDDLFFEAFADVPAWSVSQPDWQQRYLGAHADSAAAARDLFSNVMLDVAWGLFELRMLADPASDPNRCWTDITQRYLNIAPHPELSWWALRVQLVRWPGYMINYGLGAILTADIRRHIEESIGAFDSGNPRWYAWTSAHLLRFGSSVATPQLVRQFLGRDASPEALLEQIGRVGSAGSLSENLVQTALQ